jgi:hypothetical protein
MHADRLKNMKLLSIGKITCILPIAVYCHACAGKEDEKK